MRCLTKEELKLAPEWATHYRIDFDSGDIIYESEDLIWWTELLEPRNNFIFNRGNNMKINKRPFDITQYEFVGLDIGQAQINGDGLQINMVDGSRHPIIYKRDIVAMAKALGMISGDFK